MLLVLDDGSGLAVVVVVGCGFLVVVVVEGFDFGEVVAVVGLGLEVDVGGDGGEAVTVVVGEGTDAPDAPGSARVPAVVTG